MTTIPLSRFFKTNWLNSHRNQCSKLSRNYYETIIIGDSIVAELSRYQSVWAKFLQPLRALHCRIGGDKVRHVLWHSHNLPVVKSIKKVLVLCGTNNLNQDSPEDITDGIIEVANTFKSKYGSISIFACGILPRDFNWSVTRVYIKEVNDMLKTKCSQSCFTFICPDSEWILSNGSLDSDLFYLDNARLVENGNLKLAESIFSFINNFDNIKHSNHIQFDKSYKMAVLFKLNNADFSPLSFPNFSKSCSSVPLPLPYASACNSLSYNVSLSSKHLPSSSNKLLPMVSGVLCGKFVPNQMHISPKSFVPDLVFSVSTQPNHQLVCNSVMSFKPVPVNVSFAPMHVGVKVVRSVSCNLRVSSLAKSMFICLNTVRSLNVCNAVKSVSSTHHIRRVTHNVISNHRRAFNPKTNVLSSFRTKSSPSYSTSNPCFSPFVISSRKHHNFYLSAKLCIVFMMLFSATVLKQSIQNILVFDIIMDLILLLLVYLRFYSGMGDRLSFYFKQHKHLFKPSFDCFLARSIIKVTRNTNINNFGLHLKVFTL